MIINSLKSPNYSKKLRKKGSIKFVIIHYTGMQSIGESIKRLCNSKSKVSSHYIIDRGGKIYQLVEDLKIAWHAGKSKWGKFNNLNEFSIGIELQNKGHNLGYQNFSKKQIRSLINLGKKLKINYKIKSKNFLGHSDIAPLRKVDPGPKFPWQKLSKNGLGTWYKKKNIKISSRGKNSLKNLFFKNLKFLGYRYFSKKLRRPSDNRIIIAFQSKYLPKNISGFIDEKTYIISQLLAR